MGNRQSANYLPPTKAITRTSEALESNSPVTNNYERESEQQAIIPVALPMDSSMESPIIQVAAESPEEQHFENLAPQDGLFYAIDIANIVLIRRAIDAGADVNVADTRDVPFVTGDYPIHKAAEKGDDEIVTLLFFLQCDLEKRDVLGSTALIRATSHSRESTVKLLLSKGAKVDAVNNVGNTALHVAAYQGFFELAKIIIEHKPELTGRLLQKPNFANMTPIDYARKKNMIELLKNRRPASSRPASSGSINQPLDGSFAKQLSIPLIGSVSVSTKNDDASAQPSSNDLTDLPTVATVSFSVKKGAQVH